MVHNMNSILANTIFLSFTNNFGLIIGQNIPKILIILSALIGLFWGIKKFIHWCVGDGTTTWLGSHWSWLDKKMYKPWKGYNRLHSRKWNINHMQ